MYGNEWREKATTGTSWNVILDVFLDANVNEKLKNVIAYMLTFAQEWKGGGGDERIYECDIKICRHLLNLLQLNFQFCQ